MHAGAKVRVDHGGFGEIFVGCCTADDVRDIRLGLAACTLTCTCAPAHALEGSR